MEEQKPGTISYFRYNDANNLQSIGFLLFINAKLKPSKMFGGMAKSP